MIGWLDCSAGISGDMLLGALVDAGVPLGLLQSAVDAVVPEPVRLSTRTVTRCGLGALQVLVDAAPSATRRSWPDVRALLDGADLAEPVRRTALDVFARLAAAEAAVHRVAPEAVHFHEVGALDALADVVGAAAGLHALGLTALVASPVALGSGTARSGHGPLPVPVPAVLELLRGVPVAAGPVPREATTPTGAAVLAACASSYGAMPALVLDRVGTGAGSRDPKEAPNVLRLVLGAPADDAPGQEQVVLAANIDDLDPRLWPGVLTALLAAGAADAWLTPVLMKKGRPAHTLSVLCEPAHAADVRRVVFRETSTIGLREHRVRKHALERTESVVQVGGAAVRVKTSWLDGRPVTVNPEWEDVAAAAAVLGRSARDVLAAAADAARDVTAVTAAEAATPRSGS